MPHPPQQVNPQFNLAQQLAVSLNKRNILVSASAGSGKTTVMIERILRLLSGGASLENMIVCTFTRASAEDMRKKLLKRLVENENAEWAKNAIQALPLANISTIDSFCSFLVKEYFYFVSDIDPAFDIIENREVLLANSIKEVVENKLNANCDLTLELADAFGGSRYSSSLSEAIKSIYEFSFNRPNPQEWLSGLVDLMPTQKDCLELLGNLIISEKQEFFTEIDFSHTAAFVKHLADLTLEVALVYRKKKQNINGLDFNDVVHASLDILKIEEAKELINKKYTHLFVDEFQDINELQEAVFKSLECDKFFVGDIKQSIYRFRGAEPDIFMRYRDEFEQEENADSEVIRLNQNYRSNTAILSYCDNVFSSIMTKNFGGEDYDTDGRFIKSLSEPSGKGDIFNRGVEIKLLTKPNKNDNVNQKPLPEIYSVQEDLGTQKTKNQQIEEIVNHILALKQTTFFDIHLKKERQVQNDDIAIMLRSTNDNKGFCSGLINALNSVGVLAQEIGGKASFLDNIFARTCLDYLRLIANQRDDFTLYSILKSCICDFLTDEELLEIRLNSSENKSFFMLAKDYLKSGKNKRVVNALKKLFIKLEHFKTLSSGMPIAQLAGSVVAEYCMFNYSLAYPKGVAEEFSAFLDALKGLDGRLSLIESLAAIDKGALKQEVLRETDSVAVMTMHASKGLEFPFVVLANLDKKFDKRDLSKECLLDGKYGLAIKYFDNEDRQKKETPFRVLLKAIQSKRALEEELRLFYVGLTRGIYQVALFGEVDEEFETKQAEMASSFLDWVACQCTVYSLQCTNNDELRMTNDELLLENEELGMRNEELLSDSRGGILPPVADKELLANKATAVGADALGRPLHPQVQNKNDQLTPADTTTISNHINFKLSTPPALLKQTATQIAELASKNSNSKKEKGEKPKQEALDYGTAYHAFMEFCDFNGSIDKAIDDFKINFPNQFALLNKNELLKTATAIATKVKGKNHYKEQPFIYKNADGTLIQGIIDLLIIDGDSVEIVDYKTGKISLAQKEQYSAQLDIYSTATKAILGAKKIKKTVFSLSTTQFLEI